MRKALVTVGTGVFLVAATLAMQVKVLHLRGRPIDVPYTYSGDSLLTGMSIKTMIDTGWYYDNPALGLPGAMNTRDFPGADVAHMVAMRALAWFTPSWGAVMNLYWILSCSLIALASWLVMRRLHIREGPALAASFLFAFLPYHFARSEWHLLLAAYWSVPLAADLALRVLGDEPIFTRRPWQLAGIAVLCALIGSSGIYYAFFSCFLIAVAAAVALLRRRTWRAPASAAGVVGLICAATLANLWPSIRYTRSHGHNAATASRVSTEAETYGLKLSQLVLPLSGHRYGRFSDLKQIYNQGPLTNENEAGTLGLIGTLGFLALLLRLLFRWRDEREELWDSLGALNLAALLLGVVGGFGALFALLISPQIRAYNRISVFIGFFSLLAVALLLDKLFARLGPSLPARIVAAAALCGLTLFGVWDQTAQRYWYRFDEWGRQYRTDDRFIHEVEAKLPAGARIFELPYVAFPESPPLFELTDYAQVRPYLHSHTLRWSYGAMRGREADAWQQQEASKSPAELVETLALSGFDALYVARAGYVDHGARLERAIASMAHVPPVIGVENSVAVYDLRPLAAELHQRYAPAEFARRRDEALHPILVVWGSGFYGEERNATGLWHWCTGECKLTLENIAEKPVNVSIDMFPAAGPIPIEVDIDDQDGSRILARAGTPVSMHLRLAPGRRVFDLHSPAPPVDAPADPRRLVFRIGDFRIWRDDSPPAQADRLPGNR